MILLNTQLYSYSQFEAEILALRKLLNQEEIERSENFLKLKDRESFLISRAVLKRELGKFTGTSPEKIQFTYSRLGKPSLAQGPFFNLSHSKDCFALVIGEAEVGIDLEVTREHLHPGLERKILSQIEMKVFEEMDSGQQGKFLLRIWTMKEAVLKCLGLGLSFSPTKIEMVESEGFYEYRHKKQKMVYIKNLMESTCYLSLACEKKFSHTPIQLNL